MSCQNVSLFCCFWKPQFLLMEDFHVWPLCRYTCVTFKFKLLWCNRKAQGKKKKKKKGPWSTSRAVSAYGKLCTALVLALAVQEVVISEGCNHWVRVFATWEEATGIWSLEFRKSSVCVCMWAVQSQGNSSFSGFSWGASPCFWWGVPAVGMKLLQRIPCAWAKFKKKRLR